MDTIKIKHPTLDDGRIVEVPAQSWPHYALGGWLRADEPEPTPEPDPAPAPAPPAEPALEPTARRSRTTKE